MTTSTATPPAKAGSKKLLWVIVALLVILVGMGCAAGAWYFLKGDAPAETAHETEQSAPAPVPVFVELKPFTVNLNDGSGRILYIGITLKAEGEAAASTLREQMPEVRNRILMVLTGQQGDQLTTSAGKQALAQALIGAFEQPFNGDTSSVAVSDALFTDFIVQ
ncbi:flagellar basal body-associated protein FliL [Kushneria indalinina]|uniref:Flagellar protein FliL n=1 Tax=Kushneria indalinina DSM 14324 TaxID=1122140 RepID=A0A3D9DZW5_9GAMM|nr:flagellar basal body-associated protein FliL [Kushneria indalinina]REC96328.1 flagellar FliL protein [Kushneria indalinina DSM 14324]